MSKPKSATVLLVRNDGTLLAVSRGADTANWGMPGGWLEPGEAPADGAARELYEETGIIASPGDLEPVYEQAGCVTFRPMRLLHVPERLYSDPFEGHVAWLPPSAIACASCTFGPTNRKMLRDLGLL